MRSGLRSLSREYPQWFPMSEIVFTVKIVFIMKTNGFHYENLFFVKKWVFTMKINRSFHCENALYILKFNINRCIYKKF